MTTSSAPDCCIVTSVRDKTRYERCILRNPATEGCLMVMLNDADESLSVSSRYNIFLETYDYQRPTWFIFCHEDFEPCESLREAVATLHPMRIYGPLGTRRKNKDAFRYDRGNGVVELVSGPVPCETLDSCCLIFHSELVLRSGIRFNERFASHRYGEALCRDAAALGIETCLIPLRFAHYSNQGMRRENRSFTELAGVSAALGYLADAENACGEIDALIRRWLEGEYRRGHT